MTELGIQTEAVGRTAEFHALAVSLRELAAGRGRFLCYVGDPGIGKTTMLLALSRAARQAGIPVVWHRGGELVAPKLARPTLLVIDDLHRFGTDDLKVLDHLAALTTGHLLVATAWRPRQLAASTTALLSGAPSHLDFRQLSPFTLEQTRELVGARPDLELVHDASAGIPLYACVLADPGHPGSAQIRAELAQLPSTENAVWQVAAVLDSPFTPELLLAVSDLDTETTRQALDSLVSLDLIRTVGTGPLLEFRHRTVAAAAYQLTALSRRRSLHLRADRELERLGAPAIVRAGHVANSLDGAQPDRHLTLAIGASQALSSDPAAAASWLEAAQARLTPHHPHWYENQLLLAKAQLRTGRFDDSRAAFLTLTDGPLPWRDDATLHTGRIERLLGRYPEAIALIRSSLIRSPSAVSHATGLYELSAIAAERSEYADSGRLAAEAARIAHSAGDSLLECLALGGSAWARAADGDVAGACADASRAAIAVDAMVDEHVTQDIDCLRLLGQTELVLDRLTDAQRHLGRGVRLARRTGQRHVLPNLLKSQAELELRLGRLDRASLILDEVEPLAEAAGIVGIQALCAAVRVHVLLWQRPLADAAESVAAGERAAGLAAGADTALTWLLHAQGALGEALVFAGQPGHGSQTMLSAGGGPLLPRLAPHRRVRWWEVLTIASVAEGDLIGADEFANLAVETANRTPTAGRRGFAYRARALAEGAKGAPDNALGAAHIAASSFTAAGAQLDLGRTQLLLACIAIAAGRLDGVDDQLSIASALARRCHAERLSEQVEAARAGLPEAPRRRDWRAILTAREGDIAALAGQALASTAIAAKLHLSVRTVDTHLSRIYRKLGVPNRVALANLLNSKEVSY